MVQNNTSSSRKDRLKALEFCEVSDVQKGFRYWVSYLMDMTVDLFEYEGLPDTLPEKEIERRLVRDGFCIVFKHPVEGIVCCDGNLYDYDFYRRYSKFNVVNPYRTFLSRFLPTGKKIGKDGEVIYNTGIESYIDFVGTQGLFFNTVCRYARKLADCDSTIQFYLTTMRMPYLAVAPTDACMKSINSVFDRLKIGEMSAILDSDFMQNITTLKNHDVSSGVLTELVETQKNILCDFYREIGIYSPDSKRERLLTAEVETGRNNEKILINSMLMERQAGVERINKLYGTEISVGLRSTLYDEEIEIEDIDTENESESEESEVESDES